MLHASCLKRVTVLHDFNTLSNLTSPYTSILAHPCLEKPQPVLNQKFAYPNCKILIEKIIKVPFKSQQFPHFFKAVSTFKKYIYSKYVDLICW